MMLRRSASTSTSSRRTRSWRALWRWRGCLPVLPWALSPLVVVVVLGGCSSAPRNMSAVRAYYDYDFTRAREALRGDAELRNDEQVVLNNLRLGVASMADGDPVEAERALGRVFDLLSTAGLNDDRTTAAVFMHEGVRIWKGEPFEQALGYHSIATLYAMMGDWENVRAASANALFRLTDFGSDSRENPSSEDLARREASDPGYLDEAYTAVDTNFALGFLMQAIGSDLSGLGGEEGQFEAAVSINPDLAPIADKLRSRDYDTLLLIEYGKGPTKIAYGPDEALARFEPQETSPGRLVVHANDTRLGRFNAACDVNEMSRDHRWNNLEDVRRAKSVIGDVLLAGGVAGLVIASNNESGGTALAGAGLLLAGLLTKSGAQADTRYMEFAPSHIFLVPLRLNETVDLRVGFEASGTSMLLPDFQPGTIDQPRASYLRLHGPDSPAPAWLESRRLIHGNDHAGVLRGDMPWIMGGMDVSTPSRETLETYQQAGHLPGFTIADLEECYRAEGILIGSGMENRPDEWKNPSFRHVMEGGTGLFTPWPDSMGYKRLMFTPHGPYTPRSDLVRRLRREEDDVAHQQPD